jgi:AAA domain, putative AbiEii toxin, Type IV TA system/AAA domain
VAVVKVERVHIRNFKGIRELDWDLRDHRGRPRSRAVLVGDNASGKTSVLQAIALALFQVVTGHEPRQLFKWPGFQLARIGTLGETAIELSVSLSPAEIKAAAWTFEAQTGRAFDDRSLERVTVRFERGVSTVVDAADNRAAYVLAARQHLVEVLSGRTTPAPHHLRDLGGIFWFDQLRSAGLRGGNGRTYEQGVAELRDELTKWDNFHKSLLLGQRTLQPGQRDLLKELEEAYARVFPGVSFVGVEPIGPNDAGAYFILKRDGGVTYDLAESSSGEQAVLPILYEFVRQDIGHSVVLIDEIETHLHPPLAQALYNTLPKLGPDCQFLLTTHSEAVASIVPEDEVTRIPGGRLCL